MANMAILVLLLVWIVQLNRQLAQTQMELREMHSQAQSAVAQFTPSLDARLGAFDKRMDAIDQKMHTAQDQMVSSIDTKMKSVEDRLVERMNAEIPAMLDKYINKKLAERQTLRPGPAQPVQKAHPPLDGGLSFSSAKRIMAAVSSTSTTQKHP